MMVLNTQVTGSGKWKTCDAMMYNITLNPAQISVFRLFRIRFIQGCFE